MNILDLIGRDTPLFIQDIAGQEDLLSEIVRGSRFLVIGGAGSIGQAVSFEIFKRNPLALHVVDISENNMVELVRSIRSSLGYIKGEFRTFSIDCGSLEFESLINSEGPYDYILNLSALKHVRSEEDPFTLMRMVEVNISNTVKTIRLAKSFRPNKYFCVSTDKAANPVNMMGASKRIMELFLMRESIVQPISTARFANVAFSDGSLLHSFNQRLLKRQPIVAPTDIRRYFITPQESGELCLMSCLLGENRDIFFPKLDDKLHLLSFSEIAQNYLLKSGFEPYVCESEDDARNRCAELIAEKKWPCYFFKSDTTGEKGVEEFYTSDENVFLNKFKGLGVIRNSAGHDLAKLDFFVDRIREMREKGHWTRQELIDLFLYLLPEFSHHDTGAFLNGKM
jgi:FlaA1/EpsC-like NDP-sugar epimerase